MFIVLCIGLIVLIDTAAEDEGESLVAVKPL